MNQRINPPARAYLAALVALSAFSNPVAAQEEGTSDWSGQVTAYVWAAGLGGEITPFAGGPTIRVDKSFSELLKASDGALFLSGFARRDRLVILGDFTHSASSSEGLVPPGLPAEAKQRQTSLTVAGGYRLADEGALALDILAGARAWWVRGTVDVPLAGISRSPGESFVDPIVALRANVALAPSWSVIAYADAGGFGAGSKSTSQLLATVNYRASQSLHLSGGYRHLHVDYRSGGMRVDTVLSGPLLGATLRF